MRLKVCQIRGLPGLPATKAGAIKWLKAAEIPLYKVDQSWTFSLLSLPEAVQAAYQRRLAESAGVAMGQQDDEAWLSLEAKPAGVQATAHDRAAMLLLVTKHRAAGLKWPQIAPLFAKAGFGEGPSQKTVKRWFELVRNVDPANWAPALAPAYEGGKEHAEISEEAWEHFEFLVSVGGKNGTGYPFKQAYERTVADGTEKGWVVDACYETFLRRWRKMPVSRQRTLELGPDASASSLTQYQPRTAIGMQAMRQVELDGKEFGVWCRFPDGRIGCPWVIVIVDRASSKLLGWSISTSENAEAVREVISTVCEEHGIPDLLLTDNGAAINSQAIIGGLRPRYRTKQTAAADWEVPGVMSILGIELQNTAPGAPRGKVPESIFSALRHITNSPEFHGAQRAGQNDTPNLHPVPIDFDLFKAVFARRAYQFNSMTDSRAQGLKKGESRDAAFERLHEGRIKRHVTPLMRRSVPMIWKRRKVMGDGRVKFLDGLFGDASTQEAMLQHEGKVVLIGIDPNDYHAPAIVRGWEDPHLKGRILIEKLPAYETTSVRDEAGRRRAATEKRRAKALVKSHEIKDKDQRLADLRAAAMVPGAQPAAPVAPKVHQLDTRRPFSPAAPFHQLDPKTGEALATNAENEAAQAALLEFMFPSKGMERREASGGNR